VLIELSHSYVDEFGTSLDADRGMERVLLKGDDPERFSSIQLERRRSRKQKAKSKQVRIWNVITFRIQAQQ